MSNIKQVTKLSDGLIVKWGNGTSDTFGFEDLTADIRAKAMVHGFTQKLMDAHAGGVKKYGNVAGCRAATLEVWQNLVNGEWDGSRETGGYVVEALAEIKGISVDEAREIWDGLDEESQKAVRADGKVVAWKARRDLERANEKLANSEGSVLDSL